MSGYDNSFDPFSVCFNILKMRYKDYDESITSQNFLSPSDKVNVFINLETVFKHLSMIPDLEKKLILQRDFHEILVSNILNLIAHYKRFFVNNRLDTKVYIYNTDLLSDEFNQYKYNEDFRTYYLVKYNSNPKFLVLTDALKGDILPDVKLYCEFIPNVYYISAHNIEGSLVPYIIAKQTPERKNLIIGGELYDTQYSLLPNFLNHYIRKTFGVNTVECTVPGYIKDITKKDEDDVKKISEIFHSYSTYCSLISVLGDRIRSIDGITGVGPITLCKELNRGIEQHVITEDSINPVMIGDILHDNDLKKEFINNFYCSSILAMYDELTASQKLSVTSQIVDRIDINSIQLLNKTKFVNHPLLLEGLLI